MPNAPHGPEVPENETLCRAITSRDRWFAAEQRISSAAFAFPVFSVDRLSLAHANVYCALAKNERKRRAQQLVSMTIVVCVPSFP